MKGIIMLSAMLSLVGCAKAEQSAIVGPFLTNGVENKEAFYKRNGKLMADHAKLLVAAGHMPTKYGVPYESLGVYGWFSSGKGGYFGAYEFSEAAYEQAKRAWFGHFQVMEGSNELWPQDDWDSANQRNEINFDDSVIGYSTPAMSMTWMDKNGKYQSGWFTAKIVGIKDRGHTLILDKHAPHQAEQWNTIIKPNNWFDMCNCTNNFSPPLLSGYTPPKDAGTVPYTPGMSLQPGQSTSVTVRLP